MLHKFKMYTYSEFPGLVSLEFFTTASYLVLLSYLWRKDRMRYSLQGYEGLPHVLFSLSLHV